MKSPVKHLLNPAGINSDKGHIQTNQDAYLVDLARTSMKIKLLGEVERLERLAQAAK